MQSIVADTTPLNYLVLIQATDILPELYRTVLIPPAVKAELVQCKHSRRRARVDFAASCMVGSCEPETARRFGSGTSRRG
jgi:predicted nucleic acid-binding protein